MKLIRFFIALSLTIFFFAYLNFKQGKKPPLAKFLNPYKGFWQNGKIDKNDLDSDLFSSYLKEDVLVKFDKDDIPHIFGHNNYDAFFTQGYLTARDRLWQMDFQALATEGRVSEVIGSKALEYDRSQRRKGLKYAALRSLEKAKPSPLFTEVLQAYADGVNAYIDELGYKEYPVEYKLLDYKPEKWTVYRSMLLLKNMAQMLSSREADFENTNAYRLFGEEDFNKLFPEAFEDIDPVIPKGTEWDFKPLFIAEPDTQYLPVAKKVSLMDKSDPDNGSNNFVVSGARTMNGNTILANETDLPLNLPSIWYVNQISTPEMNVYGASIPGGPGIVIGFNDSIAWGVSNAKRDVVDWYKIDFRNSERKEYKYDNKWLKTETIIEKIKIRDEATLYDTIIHTHYGPVVYDRSFMGDGHQQDYAMKWTAHEESVELLSLYEINKSKNYKSFVKALETFKVPAQNFAFASASGDISMWVNGKFPVKWKGQGKFVLDGSRSRHEWGDDIPHDHMANIKNPELGFISSANQHPVDSTYPYYVYDYHYEFYRNRRINDRLRYLSRFTVEDAMKLQHDNFNYQASESLPMMLNLLDTMSLDMVGKKQFYDLRKWDYFNEPKRIAPSVYKAWWDKLYQMTWDEFENQEVVLIKPHAFNTIRMMTQDSLSKFFDNKTTSKKETLKDLVNESFALAMIELSDWKNDNNSSPEWFKYKGTEVRHILKLDPFSFKDIKVGGDRGTVNAASKHHGPSWRMIVELTPTGPKAWGIYPGSQTGNPGNPDYGKMIEGWARGSYMPLVFLQSKEENHKNIIKTVTFKSK